VVPYRAIRELWSKSLPGANEMFNDLGPPAFFPIWWGAWIISNVLNQVYLRMSFEESAANESTYIVAIVSGFFDIVAAILAIMVVREIQTQQTESSKLVPHDMSNLGPPPPPILNPV